MTQRSIIFFLALVSFLWLETALANLYPTQPISSTIFKAGSWNNVTWIDTAAKPSLDELGTIEIQLWQDETQHLTNLAENVDATKRRLSVHIPDNLCSDGSDYVLRFVSTQPEQSIYTAKFTIKGTTNRKGDCHAANLHRLQPTTVGHVDIVTVTMSTTASTSTVHNAKAVSTGNATSGASSSRKLLERRSKTDMRSSLGFVFWPALFGLAMAL